jgi:chromosome segregation ATPase
LVDEAGDDELKQKVISGVVNLKEAVDLVRKVDPQPEEKPVDPRPKLTIEKQKYDDLKAAFDQLQEDYDALRQNCKDLGDELGILKAIEQDEAAEKMRQLVADLRIMTEQRDRWQNQCAEMQKQINYLKKNAVRKSA